MSFGCRSVFVRFTSAKLQKNSKTCKNFAKIFLNLRISNVFCTFAADLTTDYMRRVFIIAAIAAAMVATIACNVTRTTTTKSEFYQRGDTTVQIQTKTVESYDATKRL